MTHSKYLGFITKKEGLENVALAEYILLKAIGIEENRVKPTKCHAIWSFKMITQILVNVFFQFWSHQHGSNS